MIGSKTKSKQKILHLMVIQTNKSKQTNKQKTVRIKCSKNISDRDMFFSSQLGFNI